MLRVFLAEDETIIRETLRDTMPWAQCGYTFVGEAGDGEMALPLIQQAKPDVLITDIRMPFMDGLALSKISPAMLTGVLQNASAQEIPSLVDEYIHSLEEALESGPFCQYLMLSARFTATQFVEGLGVEQKEYLSGLFFARGMTAVISTQQVSVPFDSWFGQLSQIKCEIPFGIGAYLNKKGVLVTPYVRITVVAALLVVLVTFLMLRYTKFGRSLYAVGGNQQSAALMGLNVRKTRMMSHVLCSFYATLGGLCFCLNTMCGTPTQATGLEMDAISSAVIGGTLLTGGVGNVIGTLFGVLINGTISSLVKFNGKLVASWANIITAVLLCFFILLQAIFAKIKERQK